ncbi:PKHD-type hydroxylase [Panacagrimonas perspica]|uniref:PKHD-type hydroxylase n=1 Tax=Panacagrimonas perspica TaxID=381431 RepID=A0A4V3UR09_9GAMM|nr:Fe2+-dependent dioxygenase [Panacagrimonas perspica]TDU32202.1 PKHD-type hydroxylase [Panacagrimonas perspica]THD01101.1 Fe2+-dependent dioxygenase [Panacagrimonas perspica]
MYVALEKLLDGSQLATIRSALASASFSEGASTAGWYGKSVKKNLQAQHDACSRIVHEAALRHPMFRAAAQPNVILPPLFSRYVPGMEYGVHVDDAIMGAQGAVRADLAMTVFLSDPSTYDGGELVVELHSAPLKFKMAAGDAILYPATSLHRVDQVTRGERLVSVLWIQSLVQEASRREILFDLFNLRRKLWERTGQTKTPESDLAARSYVNLMRMWAKP